MFSQKPSILILLVTTWFLSCSFSYAESLDPTKPAFMLKKKHKVTKVVKKRAKKTVPLVVKSILIASNRRLAVINDVIVGVGDKIANSRVIEIGRNYVIVVKRRKKTKLLFGKLASPNFSLKPRM